jgi:hypothetical protein
MSNILIDVAAEFTGKKAFDKAGSATTGLEKSVKSLGKTLGLTFSAAAVLSYGKASIKAAAADQKAQQQLALALKNVGLGRDAATAEGYIQRIEKEFGIIDEQLRPAYSKLAIATRDTAETQRLMGIAMDISANTGKDLDSVTAALSKAYLGNNTALSKLGIGISKADLKTKSFKDITDQLAVTFAGSAKASADSFSGSMDKLAIASNNAKEIIGTSLINALQSLGNDHTMANLSTDIEGAAKSLANFIDSLVYLKGQISSIPGSSIVGYLAGGVSDLLGRFSPQHLAELIKQLKGFQGMGNVSMTGGSNMDTQKADAAAKLAADKAAAAKIKADKIAAAAKIKADKNAADNAAKLAKAGAMFDLDKIQIEAALKGKITDEESLRLQLQRAILNEDAALADTLQKRLEASQRATGVLQGQINGIKPLADPFAEWIKSLEEISATLTKILGTPINMTSSSMVNPNQPIVAIQTPNSPFQPKPDPIPVVIEPSPTAPATNNAFAGLGGNTGGFGFSLPDYLKSSIPQAQPAPITVNVTNTGSVIMQDDFVQVISDAIVKVNTLGNKALRAGQVDVNAG